MKKEELEEYVKNLSLNDKKTLSQKALKTAEEVGELAKSILPYDSAPGTNHRFVDKYKILEEVADTYLTIMSIAYSLGFERSDIDDMIYEKSKKWSLIQSKEKESEFPLPFEIHITISGDDMRDPILFDRKIFDIDQFKVACQKIGVKPIVLDLEINKGVIKDYMTSSKHFGDNKSAYIESLRISEELKKFGFFTLRTKIETVPWHPGSPRSNNKEIENGCYFESHIGVVIGR
jgi:NTP pyrophosphatase (non-canonical NTP hydrolase)